MFINCYSLSDFDGNVFYVGITTGQLKTRLKAHLSEAKRDRPVNKKKCAIIRGLNFKILINLLEQREIKSLHNYKEVEAKWILHFLENEIDLSNCEKEKKVFKLPAELNKIVYKWARGDRKNRRFLKDFLELKEMPFCNLINRKGFSFSERETLITKLQMIESAEPPHRL